jgi:geranylgeranyl diphosphate synthase type I
VDRVELKRIYAKKSLTDSDIARIFDILTGAGALEYTQKEAQRYKDEAMAQFNGLRLHKAPMDKLRAIGLFLVERDY